MGDATDSVSDCEVRTREPVQEDAAATATEVEDWAESEQKRLVKIRHGIAEPMFVAVSVSASAPVPVPASVSFHWVSFFISKVSKVQKVSLPGIPAGIPVCCF